MLFIWTRVGRPTLMRCHHHHIRVKKKLRRKLKGAGTSSWSRPGNQKSIFLTIPWSLAKPVKISRGIIVRQPLIVQKKKGIAERAVRRIKEGTSAVLLQSGLDENCWADSMECYCYMRHIQDRLSDGKTPFERRFGEQFKDRFFHLVHRLNIILYPRQTSDESINLVRKYYL